jgi:hypothetical protein
MKTSLRIQKINKPKKYQGYFLGDTCTSPMLSKFFFFYLDIVVNDCLFHWTIWQFFLIPIYVHDSTTINPTWKLSQFIIWHKTHFQQGYSLRSWVLTLKVCPPINLITKNCSKNDVDEFDTLWAFKTPHSWKTIVTKHLQELLFLCFH